MKSWNLSNLQMPHHVPTAHVRVPHLHWHYVEHPLGLAAVALGLALALGLGASVATSVEPRSIVKLRSAAAPPVVSIPPRDWRAPHELNVDSMYGQHAKAPSVEHMYARPRPIPSYGSGGGD